EKTEKDEIQDWQRDSIQAAIAEAAGSEPADLDFDETLRAVDAVVAVGNFDGVRSALGNCARLFDRSYTDADKCSQAEQKIKSSWNSLPVTVRIELLVELIESALDHTDPAKALELLDETRALMDTAT